MHAATPRRDYPSTFAESLSRFDPQSHNSRSVRHSEVEPGFQPTYVDFAALPAIAEGCDIDRLLLHIRTRFDKPDDWLPFFEALTDVRSLYKNIPTMVEQVVGCFGKDLLDALFHKKSCVIKNALLALGDIFEHATQFAVPFSFTSPALNMLLSRAMSPCQRYRWASNRVLHSLIAACCCDALLQQLCEVATNSSQRVSAVGFNYLVIAVNGCQEQVSTFDTRTNQMIFKTVGFIMEKQNVGEMKAIARNMIRFYAKRMGDAGFTAFLEFMVRGGFMTPQEAQLVFATAFKAEKAVYPRLSLEVTKMRQSAGLLRPSMAV